MDIRRMKFATVRILEPIGFGFPENITPCYGYTYVLQTRREQSETSIPR